MLLICSNCKLVIPVPEGSGMPAREGDACSGYVECSKCHTIYRVAVTLLHMGEKYKWDPVEGELHKNGLTKDRSHGTGTSTKDKQENKENSQWQPRRHPK
jgi:hypothetical protein